MLLKRYLYAPILYVPTSRYIVNNLIWLVTSSVSVNEGTFRSFVLHESCRSMVQNLPLPLRLFIVHLKNKFQQFTWKINWLFFQQFTWKINWLFFQQFTWGFYLFCKLSEKRLIWWNSTESFFKKKMDQPWPLFHLFSVFQYNIIFTTNQCVGKNVNPVFGAGIRTHDLSNVSLHQ